MFQCSISGFSSLHFQNIKCIQFSKSWFSTFWFFHFSTSCLAQVDLMNFENGDSKSRYFSMFNIGIFQSALSICRVYSVFKILIFNILIFSLFNILFGTGRFNQFWKSVSDCPPSQILPRPRFRQDLELSPFIFHVVSHFKTVQMSLCTIFYQDHVTSIHISPNLRCCHLRINNWILFNWSNLGCPNGDLLDFCSLDLQHLGLSIFNIWGFQLRFFEYSRYRTSKSQSVQFSKSQFFKVGLSESNFFVFSKSGFSSSYIAWLFTIWIRTMSSFSIFKICPRFPSASFSDQSQVRPRQISGMCSTHYHLFDSRDIIIFMSYPSKFPCNLECEGSMRGVSWDSPIDTFRITLVWSIASAAAPGLQPLCLPRAPKVGKLMMDSRKTVKNLEVETYFKRCCTCIPRWRRLVARCVEPRPGQRQAIWLTKQGMRVFMTRSSTLASSTA